jgi:alkanesulfonate monooxygenase SsuD/methylene tetrahydromethanopterin reductase-like flavin-dependent oxidoreductase (luciferase family)
MKLSIFSVLDHHPALPRPIGQLYEETLRQAELAERLGFDSFMVAEHHFHEYGAVPNPAVFLAAAAQRTRRIRLGPAISVLPFRNPLTVAEDYALLDQLSGGRLVMGVGSGYLKHEFEGFGVAGERKRELFDGHLDALRRAWAGEAVAVGGAPATINVQPVQRPHPPIYVAALRAEAAYHIGRQGNRLMSVPYASVGRLEDIGPMLAEHARGFAEAGGADAREATLIALHAHVAGSDAEARANAAEAFDLYVATRLYARRQTYDDILRSRLGLFGSVERVLGQLRELAAMGVGHVMLLLNFGAMPAARVEASMRLFAEAVAPPLRQAA